MNSYYQEYSQPFSVLTNAAFKKAKSEQYVQNLNGYQSFKSIEEYQDLVFPLLQNESYHSLKRDQLKFRKNLKKDCKQFPLVFKVILNEEANPNRENGITFDVLKELNQMKNEQPGKDEFWKYNHYAHYLIFKESQQYFGAMYTKKPDTQNDYYTSLAIFSNKKDEMQLILPYTKEVLQLLNFENIFTTHEKLIDYKDKYIQYQKENYKICSRIWDQQLLIYFLPISPMSSYLNETGTIFNLSTCLFYQLILNPCQQLNRVDISDFGVQVKRQQELYFQNSRYLRQFNDNQLNAIRNALDFTQKITIIKGPPGTGKTQTTIGILSIMSELLIKSKDNEQGCILVLAKSNSVVNDLIRKIQNNIEQENSIIYCFDKKPDKLKVLRFGRPEKCDQDIEKWSLEIRSQNHFFYYKSKDKVKELEEKYITLLIKSKLKKKKLKEFRVYLQETQQQYTLISLLKYIEELNLKTNNQKILDAYGNLYHQLSYLIKINKKDYHKIEQDYLDQCHIIVSTLNSCSKLCLEDYFEKVKFRMCIVDEAPTALEPSLLIPFVKYKFIDKIVLLGDIKQLNPIVIANESFNYGYNRSLFQRLDKGLKQDSYQLIYQYRQMPNLAEITSELFYENQLKNGIENMQLPDWIKMKVSNNRNRLFFSAPAFTESDEEYSKKNDLECQAIITLVKYLLDDLILPNHGKKITIISAYRGQTDNIQLKLTKESIQTGNNIIKLIDYIELDTVDSFQGKENDIIILSLVRSNKIQGFLKDKKRANVALSRAKYCQYIFGTKRTMKLDLKNWSKIIKKLEKNNEIINYNQVSLTNPNFFRNELIKE